MTCDIISLRATILHSCDCVCNPHKCSETHITVSASELHRSFWLSTTALVRSIAIMVVGLLVGAGATLLHAVEARAIRECKQVAGGSSVYYYCYL